MRYVFVLILSFAFSAHADDSDSIYDVDWVRDGSITAAGTIVPLIPYLFKDTFIKPSCPCDANQINFLDRGVVGNSSEFALTFTDVAVGCSFLAPVLLDRLLIGSFNDAFWDDMLVYAQTMAIAATLVSVTKHIVQRPLPRSYAGEPGYTDSPDGYRSFYSGHTSMAMAALSFAATTYAYRKGNSVWPWVLVGGTGIAIGTGRVLGGVHFWSDVLVGFTVGTAVGIIVPTLHHKDGTRSSFLILPRNGGLSAVYSTSWSTNW